MNISASMINDTVKVAAASTTAVADSNAVTWESLLTTITLRHVTPHYVENFEFTDNTWLSNVYTVLSVCFTYVLIIHSLNYWIRSSKPFDLNWFVIIHNALLAIFSGVLFVALSAELYRLASNHPNGLLSGWWDVFCDSDQKPDGPEYNRGRIYFIYYINYLFKYWELIDTILLSLRGKPTPFLHVYHHAATLFLCYNQLEAKSCMQWLVIVINLFVHIIMYTYYTLHALHIDVWWKKIVTQIQIIQFIIALTGCYFAITLRGLHDYYYKSLPRCSGSWSGAWLGIAILTSYLLLFIKFFYDTYQKKLAAKKAAAKKAAQLNNNNYDDNHFKTQ